MLTVIPLFSGSSGNCVYVKYGEEEILIDAGASFKRICLALSSVGTDIGKIKAVLVTHEHNDHVKGLEVLSKHTNIPIYINSASADSFYAGREELFSGHAVIADAGDTVDFNGFSTDIFKTPHDSAGSVGYRLNFSDGSRFALATDIGHLTDEIKEILFGCEQVYIESNHDVGMLKNGPYPYTLKSRILSKNGHLSNDACAEFLPFLVEKGTRKIVLAHLSEENNTPSLAYRTSAASLADAGFTPGDVKLTVAMKNII